MPISDEMVEAAHKSLWSSKHWGLPDVRRALEAAEAVRERGSWAEGYRAGLLAMDSAITSVRQRLQDELDARLASSGGNRAGN